MFLTQETASEVVNKISRILRQWPANEQGPAEHDEPDDDPL
jgi:hypothetical protein